MRPGCLLKLINFKALGCGAYWRVALKKSGAYFKVRGIILMKFQNFELFSFQNNNK